MARGNAVSKEGGLRTGAATISFVVTKKFGLEVDLAVEAERMRLGDRSYGRSDFIRQALVAYLHAPTREAEQRADAARVAKLLVREFDKRYERRKQEEPEAKPLAEAAE